MTQSAVPPARPGRPVAATEAQLNSVRFGPDGLVVAIVQEHLTNEVLMVAYMDQEALRRTCETGRTWFYSRSRKEYWQKGETSGDRQYVEQISYDCDGDALLVVVTQEGKGACHTGNHSCFFRRFGEE
ncbi:MAG TPA: phosphoribosyl-AMP cyclohydrolase [Acidimicrobiales bacterium]|nr:phosphoribosyl-AMP cyclohydrolase [Acidimicrobiales bacterium]